VNTKNLSRKPTSTHDQQCPGCRFWYRWLHPGPDGDRCLMCLLLEGNRSQSDGRVEHSALRVEGRPVRR